MAKSKEESQGSRWLFRWIWRLVIIAAVIGCAISVITIQSSIAEKETELAQMEEQIEDLTAENEDLRRILDSEDLESYMEEIAREEYNYAYADEYRFYDTSRN